MTAGRRTRLAKRRRTLGFTQDSLADALGTDRSTIARWERGQCGPQPYHRSKLCELLTVSPDELDGLLTIEVAGAQPRTSPVPNRAIQGRVIGPAVPPSDDGSDELDDMKRRELLRLLSVTGTLLAVPDIVAEPDAAAQADDAERIDQHEQLNAHLWQVYALSVSKRTVYPVVRRQLDLLATDLKGAHSSAAHKRLCVAIADLLQLAGEIFFDTDQYTSAAHCYTLAADAAREADAFDLWACALTRHAYLGVYERRFADVTPMLEGAARIARRGDGQLSTRHWVAAVRAEAHAGLGELDPCRRALDEAEGTKALSGPVMPGGWLRFDGTRLPEQRGTCYAALGRPDMASQALTSALESAPSPRRRGSILTDLAALGIQTRDLDQITEYGGRAVTLAEQTRSSGYVGRKLRALRPQLGPLIADDRAARLSNRIAQL